MIIVTGAYGFIGSNVVKALNKLGYTNIVAVDHLTDITKMQNLIECEIHCFIDKNDFIEQIKNDELDFEIDYVIHNGACSDTTVSDGCFIMQNNYTYSKILLDFCQENSVPLLYGSSAAIYGNSNTFIESREYEYPINSYGYSKLLFDQYIRTLINNDELSAPIVGLRYFNVYGINEWHKGKMASVVFHNFMQYKQQKSVALFQGYGCGHGEQSRDFIYIDDIVNISLYFLNKHLNGSTVSGIFNAGTGISRSFNDLALSAINSCRKYIDNTHPISLQEAQNTHIINYVPFPENLIGKYQNFTKANLQNLRLSGFTDAFTSLESGVDKYIYGILNGRR